MSNEPTELTGFAKEREWAAECWGTCGIKQAVRRGMDLGIHNDPIVLETIISLTWGTLEAAINADIKESGDQLDANIPVFRQLGIAPDDRLLIALVDKWPDDLEIELVADVLDAGGTAILGAEFDGDVRVVDVVRADGKPVRWWNVEAVCRMEKIQELSTIYDGRADAVPNDLLTKRWTEDNIGDLVFRLAIRGPWIHLSRRPPEPPVDPLTEEIPSDQG